MDSVPDPLTWIDFQEIEPADPGLRIAYGAHPLHFGELRLPDGEGPHPVAVVVHGGCWLSIADLRYMAHLEEVLVELGWATWSLEFRRVDDPGGGWPGTFRDVAAGADHLREIASMHPLDLDRVVTVGHSSGGHLALWLALRSDLPVSGPDGLRGEAPLEIGGVIGFAAIADLLDFDRRPDRSCPRSAVGDLLGAAPDPESSRVAMADPGQRLPLGVPQLLVTGERDEVVPLAHTRVYARRAEIAGDPVRVVAVPKAGHFEVVAPWTAAWNHIRPPLRGFLEAVGGGRVVE